jgi:hypothetical protein
VEKEVTGKAPNGVKAKESSSSATSISSPFPAPDVIVSPKSEVMNNEEFTSSSETIPLKKAASRPQRYEVSNGTFWLDRWYDLTCHVIRHMDVLASAPCHAPETFDNGDNLERKLSFKLHHLQLVFAGLKERFEANALQPSSSGKPTRHVEHGTFHCLLFFYYEFRCIPNFLTCVLVQRRLWIS